MNDHELDTLIALAAPVTDAEVASWATDPGLVNLAEQIIATTPTEADLPTATGLVAGLAPQRRRSLRIAAVAAVVLVLGLATAYLSRGPDSQIVTAYLADDPPGPIYVVPQDGSGFTLTNGHAETSVKSDAWPIEVVVLGTRSGGAIRDMTLIMSTVARRDFPGGWTDIDTPEGPAHRAEVTDHMIVVSRQHGEFWLTVWTGPNRLSDAIEVLNSSGVTVGGRLKLSGELSDLVVDRVMIGGLTEITTTYAEVSSDPVAVSPIVIETITAPSPLVSVAVLGSEISETTIQGQSGWRITRPDPEGEWNGITWQASPNRSVAVSGQAPIGEITEVANALHIVDEETWAATVEPG